MLRLSLLLLILVLVPTSAVRQAELQAGKQAGRQAERQLEDDGLSMGSYEMCAENQTTFGGAQGAAIFALAKVEGMDSPTAKLNAMRDSLQAYRGGSEDPRKSSWNRSQFKDPLEIDFQGYATGMAVFVTPGLILAIISLTCCIPFTVGRFFRDCGNLTPCCDFDDKLGECLIKAAFGCKCYKRDASYTCCQKFLPFFFYILFSSAAMAVGVMAITQIGTFSDGLSSLVCDTEQIRVQTASFVDNIAAPLQWIRGNVTTVVVGVEKDLAEIDKDRLFEKVRTSLDEISPALSELDVHAKLMKTVVDDAAGIPWMSEMVTPAKNTLLRQIAMIKEEVTTYRVDVADKLQATSDAVKSSLTSRRGCIEMASNATIEANAVVKQFLGGEFKSVVDTLKEVFGPLRFYTYPGASAALGAVVLPFLMAMVGLFFMSCGKYTNCTGVKCIDEADDWLGECCLGGASFVTFLAMGGCLLVAGISLPTGVISSDICVVLETLPDELTDYVKIDVGAGAAAAVAANSSATSLGVGRRRRMGASRRNGGEGVGGSVGIGRDDVSFMEDVYGNVLPFAVETGAAGLTHDASSQMRRALTSIASRPPPSPTSFPAFRFSRSLPSTTSFPSSSSSALSSSLSPSLASSFPSINGRRTLSTDSLSTAAAAAAKLCNQTEAFSEISAAMMLETCFKNKSLGAALNLSTSFSFVALDFSVLDNITVSSDNFAEFDSLRVTVNKYTPTSFGYDDAKIQQLVKAARDKGYDGEATRLEAIKPALEKSIRTMKNLTATIGSKVDVLNTATLTLATVLMHIRKDTEPLVATAKGLLTASTSCGFVKGIYESMYASLCSTALTAIVWVALLQLAAGVCAVPMVVCNVLLLLRLSRKKSEKRRGSGGGGDDDDMDYEGDVAIMPMGKGHMGTKFPTREALMEAVTGGKGGPVMA